MANSTALGVIAASLMLTGCQTCTTFRAPAQAPFVSNTSSLTLAQSYKVEPMQTLLIENGEVQLDAASSLDRFLRHGSTRAHAVNLRNVYAEILNFSVASSWSISSSELSALKSYEEILVTQPNIFQCFAIKYCQSEFPRTLSPSLEQYQLARSRLALAADVLAECRRAGGRCEREESAWDAKKLQWFQSDSGKDIESALIGREELFSRDPAQKKITALERLESSIKESPFLFTSSEQDVQLWLRKSRQALSEISLSDELTATFPAEAYAANVVPVWMDLGVLANGMLTIDNSFSQKYSRSSPQFPHYVVLRDIRLADGMVNVEIVAFLSRILSVGSDAVSNKQDPAH